MFVLARTTFSQRHDKEGPYDIVDVHLKIAISQLKRCKLSIENGRIHEAEVVDPRTFYDIKFDSAKEVCPGEALWKSNVTIESDSSKLLRAYENLGIASKVIVSRKRSRPLSPSAVGGHRVVYSQPEATVASTSAYVTDDYDKDLNAQSGREGTHCILYAVHLLLRLNFS